MNIDHVIFTYTPDMMRPLCGECGRAVSMPDDHDDPTQTWVGVCPAGHSAQYELDEEDWDD